MKKHVATGTVLTGVLAAYSAGFAGLGDGLFLADLFLVGARNVVLAAPC